MTHETNDSAWLAARFEEHRGRMRGIAYRVLGSATEADDAVQEAWLRLSRTDAEELDNLAAWLTTVVGRISLNMLRSRKTRREEPLDVETREPAPHEGGGSDPEAEAILADSVGVALLVVLDTLSPAERLAFVLHDLFDLPFDEIGPIVGRSSAAARQLASRARRRVRGTPHRPTDLPRQRRVVDAYLAAVRDGDFDGLLRLLDPEVVLRADAGASPAGRLVQLRGAEVVARAAMASSNRARYSAPALVEGSAGIVMAPRGQLFLVLSFAFAGDHITAIDVISDADRLRDLDLAVAD
ncbi:MAG TPA: sigma-70 family RNA polymerase sigma factor [Intrasporangium sp.]|uniref:sigma-70 family RNA polymerase sigma factor n=1 Tax=Intrasporangium sp. TaxID=1925024 RepID=UPI002B47C8A4|nr:sigma-70 family RNA polymerase sigma factor [Intrasporangium sp.]HKX66334.1 sigma-70 family RNA polymerase sigma factor [Intrasporangium sp.]